MFNSFTRWGGYWDYPIDYQHFEVPRKVLDILLLMPKEEAKRFLLTNAMVFKKTGKDIPELDDLKETNLPALYKSDKAGFEKIVGVVINSQEKGLH